jgi:hypothetical protein
MEIRRHENMRDANNGDMEKKRPGNTETPEN